MSDAARRALIEQLRAIVAFANAQLAALEADDDPPAADDADDLTAQNLVEVGTAAARFSYAKDTIRLWCRDEECGVKRGGRWLASIPRIRRKLESRFRD